MLRKVGGIQRPSDYHYKEQLWHEVSFGPVRIKLRATEAHEDLGTLVSGDLRHTVSRRDPVHERIGFCTSGNWVYSLANPNEIAKLVELCDTDLTHRSFTLARTLAHAVRVGIPLHVAWKLFDVLLIELQEHTAVEQV